MDMFGMLLDALTVGAGLFLIIAPDKAYNFGRKEKQEVPANWVVRSRIFGVVFLAIGGVFIYISYFV